MEDKMFELMEKMYNEFSSFKTEMTTEVKGIRQDVSGLKGDVKSLSVRVDKNTMLLENLKVKVETIAEIQKSHMEQNANAHNDIMNNVSNKIDVIESAVKDTSKDVKEIKSGLMNVELITSSNWNEIVKLKAVR
jgi:chromosome segregation ATPase